MANKEMQQRIDLFMQAAANLPGAKSYHRLDWDINYLEVAGKMFGMLSVVADGDSIITLKNYPEENEHLRELYPQVVIPGYYANKQHWNSIKLASEALTDEEIIRMIQRSYELVVAKLPKKVQATL